MGGGSDAFLVGVCQYFDTHEHGYGPDKPRNISRPSFGFEHTDIGSL